MENPSGLSENVDDPVDAQATPQLYQLLVESVRDYATFALKATGDILTWNRGAERLKGNL